MPKQPEVSANELVKAFQRMGFNKVSQKGCHIKMAVIVDQKRLDGGSSSTVGTVTDIAPILRLLFARLGKPNLGHGYISCL